MNAGSAEYRRHYETLARIAQRLESGDADIDEVLPLLEEARVAYEACRARLEAVRRALGEDEGTLLADEDEDEDDEDDDEDDEENDAPF
jgi:exodeoxyribonuclease VII small subunit